MSAPSITPCLWFDHQAEEAVDFYLSVFGGDSKVLNVTRYNEVGPGQPGTVLTISFRLAGREFLALNGGPYFTFNEAVSLVVHCDTQAELDFFWQALTQGGTESQCGWLKDRYGLSWQVVPRQLDGWLQDPSCAARVMEKLLQMTKLDLAALEKAAQG